jgi:prepilin-type processing-associated H-X9-DG protein/prepilin-type N-terminal cleavage/methylation domain-containing protein
MNTRPPLQRAFTVIELLVVIVVITILAGVLLPGLSRAKAKAQSISCMNNLKELQLAWIVYADDNNQLLPANQLFVGTGPASSPPGCWVLGNAQMDLTSANIQQGVLFPYARSAAIYHCPSDQATVVGAPTQPRTRSYTLSGYLGCSNPLPEWASRMKTRYSQVSCMTGPSPTGLFVLIEEHEKSIEDGFWEFSFVGGPYGDAWDSLPSDRHNQGCNLSFADGHVDLWKWSWPKRFSRYFQPAFPTQDLSDLRKLQAACP